MHTYLPFINNSKPEKRNNAIRQFIRKNKLSYLTHFTRIDYLKSILQFGILPASVLKSNKTFDFVRRNDVTLPPGWDGLVSMNISFPDYRLFNQLQNHQPSDWVILLIDPRVLTDFPCYFFPGRAIETIENAPAPGMPLTDYQNASDLKALFMDRNDVKRKDLDIPSFYTTDPASEVLSFFPIAPSYITQVWFHSDYKFNMWVLSNTEFAVTQDRNRWACGLQYFSPRSDYTYWKRGTVRSK
ncbi:MAG: hypothetical protein IJI57_13105 [Flexilinea sp.]|nr:hypothetical protein [Flexilinea sp.]